MGVRFEFISDQTEFCIVEITQTIDVREKPGMLSPAAFNQRPAKVMRLRDRLERAVPHARVSAVLAERDPLSFSVGSNQTPEQASGT